MTENGFLTLIRFITLSEKYLTFPLIIPRGIVKVVKYK